jgi:hypothetical protein
MIILDDVDPIFVDYFIKVRLGHHLFYFVETIILLSFDDLNMVIVDDRIQINADFFLVLKFIDMDIGHFHLFDIDRLVIRPVIFLEMLNGHKLLSSSSYSWLSYNTHCIVQIDISIIERGSKRFRLLMKRMVK